MRQAVLDDFQTLTVRGFPALVHGSGLSLLEKILVLLLGYTSKPSAEAEHHF
jgi:hypothetical protein